MFTSLLTATIFSMVVGTAVGNETEPTYNKNKIDNYDVITISQSGSLYYSVTNQIIESANNLNSNLTFIGRANVGLDSVISPSGEIELTSLENYLYNISLKTIDSSVTNYFCNEKVSEVIINDQIVISSLTADRYDLSIGY